MFTQVVFINKPIFEVILRDMSEREIGNFSWNKYMRESRKFCLGGGGSNSSTLTLFFF